MNIRPVSRVMAVIAAFALTGPATADVTLSSSNNPTISLDQRLGAVFGAERKTMNAMRSSDFARLVVAPNRTKSEDKGGKGAEGEFLSRAYLDTMPAASGGKEWACLAEALYFEARGESVRGMFGVAEVIMNRVDDPRYPGTVCGVVNQGTGERYRCQFTYTCDGRPEVIHEPKAYRLVGKVAKLMIDGAPRLLTKGATHYHTKAVNPRWSRVFPRTTAIGYHFFYREPSRSVQG